MPLFSAFAPFGMLSFSAVPTHAEAIYRSMVASLREGIDQSPGSPDEAESYADAMSIARAMYTLERAGNALDPRKAPELIPDLERDYDVRPGPNDDLHARRMRLAALGRLPGGASYLNVRAALADLLGEDFVAYHVVTGGPTIPADDVLPSVSNFQPPGILPQFARLTDPITDLGVPLRVGYRPLDPFGGDPAFATGERVIVSAEGTSQVERVTVADAGPGTFVATFARAHDVGALVTTMNFPAWASTQRTSLIVLTARAAADPEPRRRVHELLRRVVRGVSTWAIVASSELSPTTATVGPFRLPALLGATPLAPRTVSRLP